MDRPGFYFLVCPDSELIRRRRLEMIDQYQSAGPGMQSVVFWADDGLTQNFWDTLTLPDLLGGVRVLVLRRANLLAEVDWKKLASALNSYKEHCFPLLCLEVAFEKGGPAIPKALSKRKIWDFALERKWVWQSPGLTRAGLRDMVRAWAKKEGLTFEPGIEEALCAFLPLDGSAVASELGKLALARPPDRRLARSVLDLLDYSPQADIFSFLSGLQKGSSPIKVWQDMFAFASDDSGLFLFLALLARDARQLWGLMPGHGGEVRLPPQVLAAKSNLARSLGQAGVARIFDLAMEAESGVKSGRRSPYQAMELLLAGLMDVFARQRGVV